MDLGDTRYWYAELAHTAKRHETPCGDGTMVWREWGEGAPVVMLHGGSGSWRHWIRNIPQISQHYRVLVADLPGLGDSDMPPFEFDHGDLLGSVRRLAQIVLDGILKLTQSPVALVGFSAGSITAAQLAACHSPHVRSLHIAGGSGMGIPWGGLAGKLRPMAKDMTRDEKLAVQAHNTGLIMCSTPVASDSIEAELQLDNTECARLRTHPLADSDVTEQALQGIKAPLQMIWGSNDPYAGPDLEGRVGLVRKHHPNADIHLLGEAGHWVMYERFDAYNPLLLSALARHAQSGNFA
jgi:pimeloyl-ACP methyl ester carboxylesterase